MGRLALIEGNDSLLRLGLYLFSLHLFSPCSWRIGRIAVQGGLKLALAGNKFYPGLVFSSVLSALAAIVGTMILSSVYPIYLSTRIDPVEVFREDKL